MSNEVPFARVRPASNGSSETDSAVPAGPACRDPLAPGLTAVTLAATETASEGTPHLPLTANTRVPFAGSAGPPDGPAGPRVSRTRQGGSVEYDVFPGSGIHAMRCAASSVRYTRPCTTIGLSQWMPPTFVVSDQRELPVVGS